MEMSTRSVCVFQNFITYKMQLFGQVLFGVFFLIWNSMQVLEVTSRVPSGMVLKMKSMGFSGTIEQKYQLFSVSYGLDYEDELYASLW